MIASMLSLSDRLISGLTTEVGTSETANLITNAEEFCCYTLETVFVDLMSQDMLEGFCRLNLNTMSRDMLEGFLNLSPMSHDMLEGFFIHPT